MLIEDFCADGSPLLTQMVDASGIKTLDQYDSVGRMAQETVRQTDGTYVQSNYATDRTLLAQTARHLDGSCEIDTYEIGGQAYSARHDVIDASGHRLAATFDNNDGSHTMIAYASGVTLTSTTTNDVMNSAGGDTFVFKQVPGHDIIYNFNAGDVAGHDTLQIDAALAADFSHLSFRVVGHDTVIDLGPDASITLTGITTPLTAHDILIV